MKSIKIREKTIRNNGSCFIIAEAGVNHNGDINSAKKLVDAAKNVGADAVKFQTFKSEKLVTDSVNMASYQIENIGRKESQYNMLKKLELEYNEFIILKKYCDSKDIIFLSTPHSFDAIDFLDRLVPAFKFGSGDITNIPTLRYAARKNKPIILGTGMSTIDEVKTAIDAIKKEGNNEIIVLHCTTNYPCQFEEVNLRAILTMQNELDCLIGYSDHSLGNIVSVAAVSMGAVVIEKHLTLDKTMKGPDHCSSLNPDEFKNLVYDIRNVEKILGNFCKKPEKSEKEIKNVVRKSLVANKNIEKGSILDEDMIVIKRPGTGLPPFELEKIFGKKTKKNIVKDELFDLDMVE